MTGYRRPCTFPGGCDEPDYALRLCKGHYEKDARIRQARGDADRVSTDPVRQHVQLLRWRGWSWQQIASAGGSSSMMLHRIMGGGQPLMRHDKVTRLLAVEALWQHSLVAVPMVGTRRRLAALAWQGWSCRRVSAELGICEWTIPNTNRSGLVQARTAARIAGFYDVHAYTTGPDPAYAKRARNRRCLPAWVWDEDGSIEHPATKPAGKVRPGSRVAS